MPQAAEQHDPEQAQAGQEELREPDRADHQRHADVGLAQQQAEHDEVEHDRDDVAGEAFLPPLLGEQPGGDDAKVGLTNSDGCSEKPARLIQRRAPLISAPMKKVRPAARSSR